MPQEDKIKEETNTKGDSLSTARGFVYGCLLSTGIWLVIIFISYMIMDG